MNIALRRAVPAALTVAMALSATIAYAPAAAYADTHSSTELTLRQVDNPFNVGTNQHLMINERESITLKGDITGGFGDVSYQWFVSTDGGNHWEKVNGTAGIELRIENAQAGDYVYRLIATDMYGNTAHQDFYVTVNGADSAASSAIDAVSDAVKTGDALPIAGIAGAALMAGGLAARSYRKQAKSNEEDAQ
mgnify:CR=1 FL=1